MKKIPISTIFVLLAVPFIAITGLLMSKPSVPVGVPSCYLQSVCDSLQLLSADKAKEIDGYNKMFLDQYDIDARILTSNMTAASAINYVKASQIGSKSKSGFGVLFMVSPQDGLVRFHATLGLNEVYTNDFISYFESQQMMPFFTAGKVSQGIVESYKVILFRAKEAKAGKAFEMANYVASARAATAEKKVAADTSNDPLRNGNVQRPTEIVSEYLRMMLMNNASYNLPIYSQASQIYRRNYPMTAAQMKSEFTAHTTCEIYKEVILDTGFAAVLYDVSQRQCSPYFLVFENGAWRMDIATMSNHIVMDQKLEWHLNMSRQTVYSDTLLDWKFDQAGVPHAMPPMRWGLLIDSDFAARVTFVKKIYDNTPATQMPLKEKDVILAWDGLKNPTHTDIEKSMVDSDNGKKITVLLWRKGQRMTVEIEAPPRLEN